MASPRETTVRRSTFAGSWAALGVALALLAVSSPSVWPDEKKADPVEANDAYALGVSGLSPPVYAERLEARWLERVGA